MAVLKPTCQFDVSLSIQQYAARVCVCVCVWVYTCHSTCSVCSNIHSYYSDTVSIGVTVFESNKHLPPPHTQLQ